MFYLYDIKFSNFMNNIDSMFFKMRVTKDSVSFWGSSEYTVSLHYNTIEQIYEVIWTSNKKREIDKCDEIVFEVLDSKLSYYYLSLEEFIDAYRSKQVKTLILGKDKSTYPEKKLYFNRYEIFLYENLKTDIDTLNELFKGVNQGDREFKKVGDYKLEYWKPFYFCTVNTKIPVDTFIKRWLKIILLERNQNY